MGERWSLLQIHYSRAALPDIRRFETSSPGGFFILWIRMAIPMTRATASLAARRKGHGEFSPRGFHLWCHGPYVSRLENRDSGWNARKQWFHGRWSTSGHVGTGGAFVWNCGLSERYRKYSAICLNPLTTERANSFACCFSKSLGHRGNRNFSWLCGTDIPATQPCWSHRCRGLRSTIHLPR